MSVLGVGGWTGGVSVPLHPFTFQSEKGILCFCEQFHWKHSLSEMLVILDWYLPKVRLLQLWSWSCWVPVTACSHGKEFRFWFCFALCGVCLLLRSPWLLGCVAVAPGFVRILYYPSLASKESGLSVLSDTSLGVSKTDYVSNFIRTSPRASGSVFYALCPRIHEAERDEVPWADAEYISFALSNSRAFSHQGSEGRAHLIECVWGSSWPSVCIKLSCFGSAARMAASDAFCRKSQKTWCFWHHPFTSLYESLKMGASSNFPWQLPPAHFKVRNHLVLKGCNNKS